MVNSDKEEKFADLNEEENQGMETWLSEMEKRIELVEENDEEELFFCMSQLIDKLLNGDWTEEYTEVLFPFWKKMQKKAKFSYELTEGLGINAYRKEKYRLAELAFLDADIKHYLAYMIRRDEVKDPTEYSKKMVVQLLKEDVDKKDPFAIVNMALFWAIKIRGDKAWKLADCMMSQLSENKSLYIYSWWLEVGLSENKNYFEGYLVHYWLLKYQKISNSRLGTKDDLRIMVQFFTDIPSYI